MHDQRLLDLIDGLPIRLCRNAAVTLIEWRDGVLCLDQDEYMSQMGARISDAMFMHELGHVIAATPEQLFARNLGLPIASSQEARPPKAEIARTELFAMGVQMLYRDRTLPTAPLYRTAACLFGVQQRDIEHFVATWSHARVRAALIEQTEKCTERCAA